MQLTNGVPSKGRAVVQSLKGAKAVDLFTAVLLHREGFTVMQPKRERFVNSCAVVTGRVCL